MTLDKIKTGDLVRLKSGGPTMTVVGRCFVDDTVIVCWFDLVGFERNTAFPAAALKDANEPPGPGNPVQLKYPLMNPPQQKQEGAP